MIPSLRGGTFRPVPVLLSLLRLSFVSFSAFLYPFSASLRFFVENMCNFEMGVLLSPLCSGPRDGTEVFALRKYRKSANARGKALLALQKEIYA